ncbi:MAG: hypothetical protein R2810_01560 [Flavobacteriales bacterium]
MSALRDRHAVVLREVVPGFDEAEACAVTALGAGGRAPRRRPQQRCRTTTTGWCPTATRSTMIVSAYLSEELGQCTWMDARDLVVTDATHRAARVDWEANEAVVHDAFEQRPDREGGISRGRAGLHRRHGQWRSPPPRWA